jgi:hypothetical protein
MHADAELADVQRWFQAAILGDEPPDDAGAVVHRPPRLDVYRSGYRLRLVKCLRETHPALRHALGADVFDAFALDYVQAHPSHSYTLLDLGAGFAGHLAGTRPDDAEWADFVIDLARLERAFLEAYEGPGEEDRAAPQPPVEPVESAVAEPARCLRLLRSRYPVGDYLLAVRRGERPPLPGPRVTRMALGRRDYVVTLIALDEPRYAALESLADRATAGEAAAAAGLELADLWTSIRAWAEQRLLREVLVP